MSGNKRVQRRNMDEILNKADSTNPLRDITKKNNSNLNSTMTSTRDKLTVSKDTLNDLKERAAQAKKMEREAAAANRKAEKSEKDLQKINEDKQKTEEELQKALAELKRFQKARTEETKEKAVDSDYSDSSELSKPALSKRKLPRKKAKAKVKKEDLCNELVAHVTHAAKTVLFRTCKFIEDELEEMEVTKELIPYLPSELKISEEEFVTNYSDIVYEGIKAARTDVQSNGKKRAQELYDTLKPETPKGQQVLPTTDEILDLLQATPEYLEAPENARDKKIVLWYQDRYLPVVVGLEYWGPKNRHYKLLTDTVKLRNGEEKVLCTISSEAFGLMSYDNCRDKWEEIMNLKAENRGAAIPRKGDAAKVYEAKWTLTKEGQKKYGGWKDGAYDRFNELQETVLAIREAEEASGKIFQKYCLKIMRKLHKIPDDKLTWEGPVKRKKVEEEKTVIDPTKRKKVRLME